MRQTVALVSLMVAVMLLTGSCVSAETIRSDVYGFELTIPDPATIIRDRFDESTSETDFDVSYQCRSILYKVYTSTGTKAASAAIAEGNAVMVDLAKMSGQSHKMFDFATSQGVHATGVGGTSHGRGQRADERPQMRRKFDEIADQLFGDSCHNIVLALPLNERKGTILTMWVWGPGDNAAGVEKAAKTLVESIKIDSLSGGNYVMNKPTPQPTKRIEVKLSKGEIDLRGVVTAIDRQKKTLDMRVREVTEFGKQPVKLNPERPKTVLFDFVPSDVQLNSDVVVVGKSVGTGKPMKASLVLIQPEITK